MLEVNDKIQIADTEIELSAIRAQGSGGQNVNKVSSAIHLRFDIAASSLPEAVKERLLSSRDSRINRDGVIIIKAQNYRRQEQNRAEALERLADMIRTAALVPARRIPTRPTRASRRRRLEDKKQRSAIKKLRSKDLNE